MFWEKIWANNWEIFWGGFERVSVNSRLSFGFSFICLSFGSFSFLCGIWYIRYIQYTNIYNAAYAFPMIKSRPAGFIPRPSLFRRHTNGATGLRLHGHHGLLRRTGQAAVGRSALEMQDCWAVFQYFSPSKIPRKFVSSYQLRSWKLSLKMWSWRLSSVQFFVRRLFSA